MLALFFVAVFAWGTYIVDSIREQNEHLVSVFEAKQKQRDMIRLSESIETFRRETNQFPVSLDALSNTAGFEHISTSRNSWQSYSVSGALTDGTWTFSRAVAFTNDPSNGLTLADYLGQNACGTGTFATATGGWCGLRTSIWFVSDTRTELDARITTERVRLNRFAHKLTDYFNTNGKYPSTNALGAALSGGSVTALADLVGYSGAPGGCTGQYQYQGIPIDCGDMFDEWGGRVAYQFESGSHVMLVSEPPIRNSAGTQLVIAVDLT